MTAEGAGVGARWAAIALVAAALAAGCRQDGSAEKGVVLLRQSPEAGSVLRNRDAITWEWSDAMRLDAGVGESASGRVAVLPPVPGQTYWRAPSILTFTPDQPWPDASNIAVKVTLPSSLAGRRFKPLSVLFHGYQPPPADESMYVQSVQPEEAPDSAGLRILFSRAPAPGWERFVRLPATNVTWESGTGTLARIRGLTPGQETAVTFLAGLPARNGTVLARELTVPLTIPDLKPRLRFKDAGHYLSSAFSRKLEVESLNIRAFRVSVWKIYTNNLPAFARTTDLYDDQVGHWVWNRADDEGDEVTNRVFKLNPDKNRVCRSIVDLNELTRGETGLFYVILEESGTEYNLGAHKVVIVTDLGLSVVHNETETLVWTMSLAKGTPVPGVTVTAYSPKKQSIGTAVTDGNGLALIRHEAQPFLGLVTGVKDSSMALLKPEDAKVLGPSDEGGRPFLLSGYEAFLYADRGIYRPGETVHIRAVVRGPRLACPPAFPVQLEIRRPDGMAAATLTAMLGAEGTAGFTWECPVEALTGRYEFNLKAGGTDRAIGSLALMMEDFVPPTLAASVKGPAGRVPYGTNLAATVEARHLFGGAAAGQRAILRARLGPQPFQPDAYPGFVFGDPRQPAVWRTIDCGEKRLDAEGRAEFAIPLTEKLTPGAALACTLAASVIESSGRACPAVTVIPLDVHGRYIGLKPMGDNWNTRSPIRFQAVMVTPNGKAIGDEPLIWTLSRVRWNWHEESRDGDGYQYRYDRILEPVREGRAEPGTNGLALIEWDQTQADEFELVVTSTSGAEVASAPLYVSDYAWGQTAGFRQPDKVVLRADREAYKAGDEALLTLAAPFAGKALITLENGRILESKVVAMTNSTVEIRLPIRPDHGPNVFVRASVVRPQEGLEGDRASPAFRAAGQVSLKVNRPESAWQVSIDVPERVKPASPLSAVVTVRDSQGQPVQGEVTVAAVDEGILQLTGYADPDPLGYFLAPRSLQSWLHDGYALLLPDPETVARLARLKTGGDAMGAEMAGRLNPIRARRFVPVALWSGTLRTGPDGRSAVTFPVPEFAGQLRVTAVAAGVGGFGQFSKKVVVRRDWVVESGLPRAASPGDWLDMACRVFNEGASAGEAELTLQVTGSLTGNGSAHISLEAGASTAVTFRVEAGSAGVGKTLLAVTAGGERWEEEVELPVRPAWPSVTLTGTGMVKPGETAALSLPEGWISNWGTSRLACSGSPGLQHLGALEFLDGYPYGCLEQTISKAFPCFAAADLLKASGQGYRDPRQIRERVEAGIRRVLEMQTAAGGFALWPKQMDIYDWGTSYAVLFLARARQEGYAVPAERMDRACDWLEQRLGSWLAERQPQGWSYAATALAALASAGRPDQAALSRLMREEAALDPDGMAWTIQALLAAGRRAEAADWLERLDKREPVGPFRETGLSLASSTRADALLLDAWLQVNPDDARVPLLVKRLIDSRPGGAWYTTQDNAWALVALGRYARMRPADSETCRAEASTADRSATWTLTETNELGLPGPEALRSIQVRNLGDRPLFYAWSASGVPTNEVARETDKGLRIRRRLMDLAGRPLDGKRLRQGELAVVQLVVDGLSRSIDNLVIEELLPGGLEIENPNLPNGYAAFMSVDTQRLPVRYATLRDDRLIAFTGATGGGSYYYLVRAVTPGDYVWPPAVVTCMYDPAFQSLNGGGRITIEP